MKYTLGLAACASVAIASPTKTVERDANKANAACASAVSLAAGSNPFTGRTLHANSAYASEIATAMASVTDTTIQSQASAVAKTGSFLWMYVPFLNLCGRSQLIWSRTVIPWPEFRWWPARLRKFLAQILRLSSSTISQAVIVPPKHPTVN